MNPPAPLSFIWLPRSCMTRWLPPQIWCPHTSKSRSRSCHCCHSHNGHHLQRKFNKNGKSLKHCHTPRENLNLTAWCPRPSWRFPCPDAARLCQSGRGCSASTTSLICHLFIIIRDAVRTDTRFYTFSITCSSMRILQSVVSITIIFSKVKLLIWDALVESHTWTLVMSVLPLLPCLSHTPGPHPQPLTVWIAGPDLSQYSINHSFWRIQIIVLNKMRSYE